MILENKPELSAASIPCDRWKSIASDSAASQIHQRSDRRVLDLLSEMPQHHYYWLAPIFLKYPDKLSNLLDRPGRPGPSGGHGCGGLAGDAALIMY
jgi:hypothetical protein